MTDQPVKTAVPSEMVDIDVLRQRIDTTRLLDYLQLHALGNVEMSASEAAAAKYLISKVIPDAKAQAPLDVNSENSHEDFLKMIEE